VNGLPDLGLWSVGARMPQMKTAKAGREFVSSLSERAFRIGCDYSHGYGKEESVPSPTFGPPSLGTGRQDVREIGLCRLRETETRHWDQRARFLATTFRRSK